MFNSEYVGRKAFVVLWVVQRIRKENDRFKSVHWINLSKEDKASLEQLLVNVCMNVILISEQNQNFIKILPCQNYNQRKLFPHFMSNF